MVSGLLSRLCTRRPPSVRSKLNLIEDLPSRKENRTERSGRHVGLNEKAPRARNEKCCPPKSSRAARAIGRMDVSGEAKDRPDRLAAEGDDCGNVEEVHTQPLAPHVDRRRVVGRVPHGIATCDSSRSKIFARSRLDLAPGSVHFTKLYHRSPEWSLSAAPRWEACLLKPSPPLSPPPVSS